MTTNNILSTLKALAFSKIGVEAENVVPLPKSGSSRQYYRINFQKSESIIGVYSPNVQENRTFIYLANHFASLKLNVPKILAVSNCECFYLQYDLGTVSLFDIFSNPNNTCDTEIKVMAKNALTELVKFQVEGPTMLNTEMLYPISTFCKRSVMWDLNYFKYDFLKPLNIEIDEVALEDDFESLANYLLNDDLCYFQYRDFQSRNIMVNNNNLYFIDFQGGRLGPCLYDVASFLYQARAQFSDQFRQEMLLFYIDSLAQKKQVNRDELIERFPVVVAFRIMQTLGAYGFRGFFEGKPHFMLSISTALANLKKVLAQLPKNIIPYITGLVQSIDVTRFEIPSEPSHKGLTVHISSISLKNGYPKVDAQHGGGFVFDCRSLPNPGRIDRFKSLNGTDIEVIDYLRQLPEVEKYMSNVESLVIDAVNNFKERNFSYLSVAFGCTGGQHRSVYCANLLASRLRQFEGIKIEVKHTQISQSNK